jgi:predicted nucleotidyltransferase
MVNRQEILEKLREAYPYLASEYGVKRVGLFGSYAKGAAVEASDVDLIVEFERPIGFKFIELAEYLEHLLGKPVDVLTPTGVQGIRLPHVADEIQKDVAYVQAKRS